MVRFLRSQPLLLLLVFVPVAIGAKYVGAGHLIVFGASLLGIVPLAQLLGDATEVLAEHTGPRLGGLLNATLGNAAELIIVLVALRAGLTELVKASITGSILGNLLLILGLAILLGGRRHGRQSFGQRQAGLAANQMTLALIALAIPSVFAHAIEPNHLAVDRLSDGVAIVMLAIYALSLWYLFSDEEEVVARVEADRDTTAPVGDRDTTALVAERVAAASAGGGGRPVHWGAGTAVATLAVSSAAIAWLSEILVGAIEPTIQTLGWSEFFIGIILVPIVGNAAEHVVAVRAALADEMDLAMSVTLGSSMQIALLVAPLAVLASLFVGPGAMSLVFNPFELAALAGATVISAMIALDGESNWLEGAQLLAVYIILAIAFFFLPSSAG